jgi:hypothetical protein
VKDDSYINRHFDKSYKYGIHSSIHRLLKKCSRNSTTNGHTAVGMAEELAREEHPVYGHRGQ